ncbi:rhodanese-like domain-containing protein [Deinococcus psychrotolerans]|uniref:Rhodanese-like domain-containing protein n=1 Tax=Deinococcus psychrotolerans TaxID=2489213 RepID=A0A3G8YA08_9DEIO|nr:rhodanese-like domain-containing protein [Deinococcus psychrotolerans]AZI42198.1 rhodanese-like domain-containing protein [Deinococcus psychrotolerans]
MNPSPPHLFIDLRAAALREVEPLGSLISNPHRMLSLAQIEEGQHGLTSADGPVVVICERGIRSSLAVRFLRSDGVDAQAYEGGVLAMKQALSAR